MAQISEGGRSPKTMGYFFNVQHLCETEWSLCRGQIAVLVHKSPRESKNVILDPPLDDQVEAFQVGVIQVILKIEVTLRLIHKYSTP